MAANTIVVKGGPQRYSGIRKEGEAAEALSPGHIVKLNSAGKVIKNATAALATQMAFAVENEVFGKGIETAYAVGDQVIYEVLQSGSEAQARVAAGAGAIVIGDLLEAANDGTLVKRSTGVPVASAVEAVDNSGGGSEAFIQVTVL